MAPEMYFDSNDVPLEERNRGGYEKDVIPDGDYVAMIYESKAFEHKNGDKSLILEAMVSKGPQASKKFEIWISLRSAAKPKKVKMGKVLLALICEAVGKPKIRATEELHDKPFAVKLSTNKKSGFQNIDTVAPYVEPARTEAPPAADGETQSGLSF